MSSYNWMAIPEAVWLGFSSAFAGLVVTVLIVLDVDAAIVGAVGVFIGAGFRFLVALLAAWGSKGGTVTSGRESPSADMTPIPPTTPIP